MNVSTLSQTVADSFHIARRRREVSGGVNWLYGDVVNDDVHNAAGADETTQDDEDDNHDVTSGMLSCSKSSRITSTTFLFCRFGFILEGVQTVVR